MHSVWLSDRHKRGSKRMKTHHFDSSLRRVRVDVKIKRDTRQAREADKHCWCAQCGQRSGRQMFRVITSDHDATAGTDRPPDRSIFFSFLFFFFALLLAPNQNGFERSRSTAYDHYDVSREYTRCRLPSAVESKRQNSSLCIFQI